ncbi:preprotein translocase subunit SecA [Porticoccus litoralis]|uniref:Protein translocase subunit SecA n=1 Tax=Porticoccus litoralis TaxID=434086 RepID=A0AAW8AZQ7_9GAMM|nr:preprotein translocase subunit SecA [Porticoccus litoralis]MDP1520026.1 preprotein translocase subunit SecA [Porticoccus litoralis]
MKLLKTLFGTKNDREIKRMSKLVKQINALEETITALSDEQLKAKTDEFRQRYSSGESLDALLPEAFAAVREAAQRTLGMRHFDVQLIGGITLHEGRIAEMRTGEGKTLVATLAAYLNAIPATGVHIVTVNDYLAKRDAQWMAPVYEFLGLQVGTIFSQQGLEEKHQAYQADITYGTNNEFGFDYLRDNMVLRLEEKTQRGQVFAIVDEVDSILIDEARTPLIISGAAQDSSALYKRMNGLMPLLKPHSDDVPGDFIVDEKTRQIELTEEGHSKIESLLESEGLLQQGDSLYNASNLGLLHHVQSALRAHHLFHKDVEYIIQEGQVVLIDEHTGRTMVGRRLSEGLHQAIEAKEGVSIHSESQTLASTTFQNYFRLYEKLAGMTGTADTEAYEFHQIYGLAVVVIPTNKPISRTDLNDLIYLTTDEKYDAVIEDVRACVEKGAPVLVGTASIETSEAMSQRLLAAKIPHEVLNAKFHEKEAQIIAQAGQPGAVTIATNMAGRGTDIVLGGNWEVEVAAMDNPTDEQVKQVKEAWQKRHDQVIAAGGLHILGTERHESRRIDNQLRGRAGRQGDPGVSRFYLSLEDQLMRLFASDRVKNMMRALGMENGEAIEHRMVTNAIEKAQRKVEGRNFDIRKHLLEFDDVANDQRQVIYQQRNELLAADDIADIISNIRDDVIDSAISFYIPPQSLAEQWDIPGLEDHLYAEFGLKLPIQTWLAEDNRLHEEGLRTRIHEAANEAYQQKCETLGADIRVIERQVMLQVLDTLWKEHLSNMDHLRQGIGLRAYAQKNPRQEYKRESFELFQQMLESIKLDTVRFLSRVQVRSPEEVAAMEARQLEEQKRQQLQMQHEEVSALGGEAQPQQGNNPQPFVRDGRKVGRNDPCPCGSGKKYKQCHGRLG